MISLNSASTLLRILQSGARQGESSLLSKPVVMEVLKSLGGGKYLVDINGRQLQAQSSTPLKEAHSYSALLHSDKHSMPTLSSLKMLPKIFSHLQRLTDSSTLYDTHRLTHLLQHKKAAAVLKESVLHELANSTSKEHFNANAMLLLSLYNSVLSFPLLFSERFGLFQLKKRYNKKSKRTQLHFYALFAHLGAVKGSVDESGIRMCVGHEETRYLLEERSDELSYEISIEVCEDIEALFDATLPLRILDITT